MNIAVINIRDVIKYFLIFMFIIFFSVIGYVIVKHIPFVYCLETTIPLMSKDEGVVKKNTGNKTSATQKILETQLAMLSNVEKDEEIEENNKVVANTEESHEEQTQKQEEENKTIEGTEKVETKVIEENNIKASFTEALNNVEVKNQSSYDVKELIANANYQINNKDKVIIYHTHTCESYTSSEKYPYEMTGTYRTTDLNYTVSRVRR